MKKSKKENKYTYKDYWKSLTEEEKKYQTGLITLVQDMKNLRETEYKEFNNLTYTNRYDLNKETALGYNDLKSLLNTQDKTQSRISELSTATPRNKVTAILSHILQFDFQADISAYDKANRVVQHLGEDMEHLVKKSREAEKWEEKRIDVYREMIEQGNTFVMETYNKVKNIIHDNGKWVAGDPISKYEKDANKVETMDIKIETEFIQGRDVYLSNLRERDVQKQDIVMAYKEMSLNMAEKRYGNWDRWEYVENAKAKEIATGKGVEEFVTPDSNNNLQLGANVEGYNIRKPVDEVGILYIFDNVNKTYQIMINGVLMLPIGYSLYEVSPSGLLPIAKGDAEIATGFAYSKGVIDNTFADSKMADMVYQSMVQKMLQSAKPTMGNRSGRVIPNGLLYSSRLISGLRAGHFEPLLPAESRSITNSDTAFYQVVKQIMADKTVDDTFAGQNVDTKTATEYLQRQKNTIMKLYSIVEGVRMLEEQLIRLRIYSVLNHWTKPESKEIMKDIYGTTPEGVYDVIGQEKATVNKYKEVLVENTLKRDGGKDGVAIIRFHGDKDELPEADSEGHRWDILDEENMLSKKHGKQVRIEYLNADRLSRLFDYFWKVDVIAGKSGDSTMETMTYIDIMTRVANLFPDAPNREGVLRKISENLDVDPEKNFNLEAPQQQPQPDQGQGAVIPNPLNKTMRNEMSMI